MYFGFVPLSANLLAGQNTKLVSTGALTDADSPPTYRIYGPSGILGNGTGTMAFKDSGTITAASNATPIVATSAAHGLSTGTRVTIASVTGNTAANGTWTITVLDANTFSLNGSTGNGAYVSGGTWHATGLYQATVLADPAQGYLSGQTYWFWATWSVSSVVSAELSTFTVT
jgi:Ubiquitin-activating enzyme E1 FCCH domain